MAQMVWTYTPDDPFAAPATIRFAPTYSRIVEPHKAPIQRRLVAESGQSYVYTIVPQGTELELPVEFEDLPEDDETTPAETHGYNSLTNWLINVVDWSNGVFHVTDPDGDEFDCRYWSGFDTLREAAGRSRRQGSWTGVLLLRRA